MVLKVRLREINPGVLARRGEFRHLQCLVVDPQQLAGAVQTDPQVAVPVGAELAGDRIFHAERKFIELAGRAVDARNLLECVLHDPDVAVTVGELAAGSYSTW